MNLIDENEEKLQAETQKKITKYILIAIGVLTVLALILLIYSSVRKKNTLKLTVDGESKNVQSGLFYMEDGKNIYVDENNQYYVSVKKLAAILGVEYYNDEYKNKGEDMTKCYIKTDNEYTSFISNSSQIYKSLILDEQQETSNMQTTNNNKNNTEVKKVVEYEYFDVQGKVKYVNGEIYASNEAIMLGFNIQIGYDKKNKSVTIRTLKGLEQIAVNKLSKASVSPVTGDECSYENKRLLKYGLVLIKNSENCYGIANYYNYSDGNYLVSCKYSYVRFCEDSGNIILTTAADEKQGILKIDLNNIDNVETVIEPAYQLIRRLDEDTNLFLVKLNGKYGIVELEGGKVTTLLRAEYQKIGVDTPYEDMDNKYVINKKYIPIAIDDKWGIISLKGEMLIKPQFPGIGCNLGETGSGKGVIVLPELEKGVDGIVFLTKNDPITFSIINVQNCSKIGVDAAEIYSVFKDNAKVYYMKVNYDENSAMRIDIYKQFGSKVKDATQSDVNKVVDNQKNQNNSNNNNTNQSNNSNNQNSK